MVMYVNASVCKCKSFPNNVYKYLQENKTVDNQNSVNNQINWD